MKIFLASCVVAVGIYLVTEYFRSSPTEPKPDVRREEFAQCQDFMKKFEECRGDPECQRTERDGYRLHYCSRVLGP